MTGIYPFNSSEEFDRVLSAAIQDPTTAMSLLRLRESSASRSLVRIYYGPPGTGKTISAVQAAVRRIDPTLPDLDDFEACFRRFSGQFAEQVAFITFHQSLQYEDVVESIRPALENVVANGAESDDSSTNDNGEAAADADLDDDASDDVNPDEASDADAKASHLAYILYAGPIMRLIRRAIRHPKDEHVLVIDEINRGDISRILGPLISSIEPDKRLGAEFPIGFEAQYPRASGVGTRIFMPPNLHFIGTMNSADRNIALVDHALRRRFEFVEVPPEPDLLGDTNDDVHPLNLKKLLRTLNQRIAFLLDKDHMVGHAYLLGCKTNEDAVQRFARRILPLLAEYFYGNEAGLLLVLGDAPNGTSNIHVIKESEETFEEVFEMQLDAALELGYRSGYSQLSISIDHRFWNEAAVPPGPGDLNYAVGALRKIYEGSLIGTERATGSGPDQDGGVSAEETPEKPVAAGNVESAGGEEEPAVES